MTSAKENWDEKISNIRRRDGGFTGEPPEQNVADSMNLEEIAATVQDNPTRVFDLAGAYLEYRRDAEGCPFCGTWYAPGESIPPGCRVCKGTCEGAKIATDAVVAVMENHEALEDKQLEYYIRILAPGYYRSEFRNLLRNRQ